MDDMTQGQIEIRRLQGIIRRQQAEYAGILQAVGREYDLALERELGANTDTRRAFCAGMSEAYVNALDILSGYADG
jgi:hypothetical protein